MIKYRKGTLFAHLTKPSCIVHVVNNIGYWGAGFTGGLSKLEPMLSNAYRENLSRLEMEKEQSLGNFFPLHIGNNHILINLVAQRGVYNQVANPRPLNYEYLYESLSSSGKQIKSDYQNFDVVMPKIGSGLARGNWKIISTMIEELYDFPVTVFEL